MRKFEVYFRRVADNKAPEYVNLSQEYRKGGNIVADNIRRVEHVLATTPEITSNFTGDTRKIQIGDVVVEHGTKNAFIYTVIGAWALVKLIKD